AIVVIPGANNACDAALVERALGRAQGPGILLLQHEMPSEANTRAAQLARDAGWFVILNPAPARPIEPELMRLIDIVIPNASEAAALTGRPVASRTDARAAAGALLGRGARAAIVTLGGDGAVCCDGNGAWFCPAVPVTAVDTTAAGDAYIGALAAALAEGGEPVPSLGFATAAAALAVMRLGAQPSLPSSAELAVFIAQHGTPAAQAFVD